MSNMRCPTCDQELPTAAAAESIRIDRVQRWLVRKLVAHPSGLTRRELSLKCASRDRDILRAALLGLIDYGRVCHDGRYYLLSTNG